MNFLNFSDNIIRLRHERKITQESLAEFVGVTKASVSKWETKQSLPDILLLPQLAAFFDVTIDELLGYEPQLSREQIQKIYHELAAAFAEDSFEEAMEQSREYVKRYYSCYPFLFHVCNLWMNHFMLAKERTRQMEILEEISNLCCHIISHCKDIVVCENTVIMKAMADLQSGKAKEAITNLEEILDPYRLSTQSDSVLIQAYQMAGEREKADSFTQMSMFINLMNFISGSTQYLTIHSEEIGICEETITRMQAVAKAYQFRRLHPVMTTFEYQAAVIYCMHGKKQEALQMLKQYVEDVEYFLTDDNLASHGDDYFDRIHTWYENLDIGADAPRDKRVILDSFLQSFQHPAFAVLETDDEYRKLKKRLEERGKKL